MARQVIGDAYAYIPNAGGKATYRKIGTAFREGERISVKIDTLPLPGSSWEGWVNIFSETKRETPGHNAPVSEDFNASGIPF